MESWGEWGIAPIAESAGECRGRVMVESEEECTGREWIGVVRRYAFKLLRQTCFSSYRVIHVYTSIFLLEKATYALPAWHKTHTNSTI